MNYLQTRVLKYTDKEAYRLYKLNKNLAKVTFFKGEHPFKENTTFKHSGNSGDIIYALPAIKALYKNKNAHLYLHLNQKFLQKSTTFHPLGNVMLNQKTFDYLQPLLLFQEGIETCEPFVGQDIDYDLDVVRHQIFNLGRGSISRWYFNVFNIYADLDQPWLQAPKQAGLENEIIVARSHRYNGASIDYSFLKKYSNISFIGVQEEFDDMVKQIPNIKYLVVNDFLEMAGYINSCKLFIGNQSFPFSIAEGLKVNRVLEICAWCPNVIVSGGNARDFYYQDHFEKSVAELYNL